MAIPQAVAQTIIDPKAYADGKRVDDAFAWLRKEAPLDVAHPEGFDPFWVVTRHADILEASLQAVLSSANRLDDRSPVEDGSGLRTEAAS